MKNKKDKQAEKKISVKIDKSLNSYDNIILFPKKLALANKMLKEIGLPKGI